MHEEYVKLATADLNLSNIQWISSENSCARNKNEFILRQRAMEYKTLVENSPDMIARFDRKYRHIYVNPAVEKIFGITADRLLGKTWRKLGLKKEEYALWQENVASIFISGCEVHQDLKIKVRQDYRYIQVHAVPERDWQGQVSSVLVIARDITEQKRTQTELSRLDCLNLIGQMAASIGHEVRNPMTTVRGFLQVFRNKACYKKDKEFFDIMVDELDRANAIITEFLSLAKDKAVKMERKNLCTIIKSLIPLMRADALQNGKNIHLQLQPVPDILADDKEIRQMLLNFVRNGLEAMTTNGKIIIKTYCKNNRIVLAVQDQGPGILPKVRDHIGRPFLTTKEGGTGLGLAVCYSIAKRHNAEITFSTGAHGTTFYVQFISLDNNL